MRRILSLPLPFVERLYTPSLYKLKRTHEREQDDWRRNPRRLQYLVQYNDDPKLYWEEPYVLAQICDLAQMRREFYRNLPAKGEVNRISRAWQREEHDD